MPGFKRRLQLPALDVDHIRQNDPPCLALSYFHCMTHATDT